MAIINGAARQELWSDLRNITLGNQTNGLVALGDFNVPLSPDEISNANQGWTYDIRDFNKTVNDCCLVDLRYVGEQFTWSNKSFGREDFTQRKLDRALVNQ